MIDEDSPDSAGNLVGLFLEFAEKLLAAAVCLSMSRACRRASNTTSVRSKEFIGPATSGLTISFGRIPKPDFLVLLLFRQEDWARDQAEHCAHEYFLCGVRGEPGILDETLPQVDPTDSRRILQPARKPTHLRCLLR